MACGTAAAGRRFLLLLLLVVLLVLVLVLLVVVLLLPVLQLRQSAECLSLWCSILLMNAV